MAARWRDEAGLSITEVIAAVLILGLGVAGLSATLINGLDLSRQNANRIVAANLAASEIDDLLTLPFGIEGPPATGLLALVGPPEELPPVEVDGRPFTITRHVYWSTNQADPGPCAVDDANPSDENVLRIDVTVTWPRPGIIPPVASSTSVAPPVDLFDSEGGIIAVYVVDDDNEPLEAVDVNLIGPTETTPSTVTGITNEFGCAVFDGLSIGTYRPVISKPGHIDIDQRITKSPMPATLAELSASDVTAVQGVAARSRATVEFVYAPTHELTVDAQGWDGGAVPSGLGWAYSNSRGDYTGPEFGESTSVYPGTFQLYSSFCEVADPQSTVPDGDGNEVPRWPDAQRDTVIATPAGGATPDGLVTLGTVDITWDDAVVPDASRNIDLRAVALDAACDDADLDLGTTTVGGPDVSVALPWGNFLLQAIEGGTVVATDTVLVDPADIGGSAPEAVLDIGVVLESGPAGVLGPALWLDAADSSTVSQGLTVLPLLGERVTEWRDLTSFDRHAVAGDGTTNNGPLYVPGALNDLPVVRFTGSNWLDAEMSFLADTDYTISVVSRRRGEDGEGSYIIGGRNAGPANGNLHLGYRNATTITHAQWDNDYNVTVADFAVGEPARVHTFIHSQADGKRLYRDGSLVGESGNTTPLAANPQAQIGRFLTSEYFDGDVAEIVVYPRALSGAERAAIEAYLADKWIEAGSTIPSSPDDITGLQFWLDAADTSTIHSNNACNSPVSDGTSVRCWRDRSGNGRDAQPGTGSESWPTFAADAIDGEPAVRFNGSSNFLGFDGTFLAGSNYTIAVVHRRLSEDGNSWYLGSGNMNRLLLGYPLSNQLRHAHGGSGYTSSVGVWSSGEPARVHIAQLDQSVGKRILQDGVQIGSQTGSAGQAALGNYNNARVGRSGGGGNAFDGHISEVIIYDRALSEDELEGLQQYLRDKWGTP